MVSTGLTLEKSKAVGYNATKQVFNDSKPEFMKHDNHEVAIKIVFDKDSSKFFGAQMVSNDSRNQHVNPMFSLLLSKSM